MSRILDVAKKIENAVLSVMMKRMNYSLELTDLQAYLKYGNPDKIDKTSVSHRIEYLENAIKEIGEYSECADVLIKELRACA